MLLYGTSLTARLRVTSQLISTSAQKGGGGMPSAAVATPHPLNSHGYARHAKRRRTAAALHTATSVPRGKTIVICIFYFVV